MSGGIERRGIAEKKIEKRSAQTFAILVACMLFLSLACILSQDSRAQTYPTVSLTVYRIQEVDAIDLFGGDWDWYYYVGVLDGTWTWTYHPSPNGQDVIVNELIEFQVTSSTFTFSIVFCEGDFWTNDDRADLSSDSGGGADDVASCIPASGLVPYGGYLGTWNLVTETLSGDMTTTELGYFKTSGDFDVSTSTDENDANLWFDISDNYSPPTADAGPSKSGYAGDSISFDASGSTASWGSSITDYEWDFNNDGTYDSSGKIVTTTFSTKGIHTVKLRVTDSLGVHAYDTTTVEILNKDPVAAFTYSPSSPKTSDEVEFIDTSTDPDGTIASWEWDFGDGGTSTKKNPTHEFLDDGKYNVVLTVTDNDGGQDSETIKITVKNRKPVADFSCTPSDPTTVDTVEFSDSSSDEDGTIEGWEWDFGDGYTSDIENPTHKYSEAGDYSVELTVTDDDGDKDTVSFDITVAKADEGFLPGIGGGALGSWLILIIIIIVVVAVVVSLLAIRRMRKRGTAPPPETPQQPEQPPQ
jgi:PKD repeat protein